jgi:hypothetical protein
MNITEEQQQLNNLLQKISVNEHKKKRRVILFTILPVIAAVALLYYFSTRIVRKQQEVLYWQASGDSLKKTSDSLHKELDFLQVQRKKVIDDVDSMKSIYRDFKINFENDFSWASNDVIKPWSKQILINSERAHDSIIDYLKQKKIDVSTIIRYYTKKTDRGKIDVTVFRCGFRMLYVFNGNYYDSIPTNIIHYSKAAPLPTIKVIAFALIRAGI